MINVAFQGSKDGPWDNGCSIKFLSAQPTAPSQCHGVKPSRTAASPRSHRLPRPRSVCKLLVASHHVPHKWWAHIWTKPKSESDYFNFEVLMGEQRRCLPPHGGWHGGQRATQAVMWVMDESPPWCLPGPAWRRPPLACGLFVTKTFPIPPDCSVMVCSLQNVTSNHSEFCKEK